MANKTDYVELGLSCADVCGVLHRGMNGKTLDDLSQSVREAIGQLMTCVKLAMVGLDGSLMVLLVAELSRRFRQRSLKRANGIYSPDLSMQRMTKIRSLVGSRTSIESFRSSPCVQSSPLDSR